MKRKLFVIASALLILSGTIFAQEYKLAKNSGKLEINEVNHVTIEGYNGNEIVFTALDGPRDKDKRAEGLRAVSSMGLEDNTGIGLSVVDKGTTYEVYQLKKMGGPNVKIMVPKGVAVSYRHSSPYGSDIKFRNIESSIEISTVHSSVHLDNVTGPMNVRTVHGHVEVNFNDNIKSPVSISSPHGHVDVALPASVKANVSMSTSYGEIFVDPALNLEIPKQGDWVKYGSNKVEGKINGGGLDISLSSTHSNVYLRKK